MNDLNPRINRAAVRGLLMNYGLSMGWTQKEAEGSADFEINRIIAATPQEQPRRLTANEVAAIQHVFEMHENAMHCSENDPECSLFILRAMLAEAKELETQVPPPPIPRGDTGVHLTHCYQGEYAHSCKYGETNCPAKSQEKKLLTYEVQGRITNERNTFSLHEGYCSGWHRIEVDGSGECLSLEYMKIILDA